MKLSPQEAIVYEWIKNTLGLPVYGDVFYGAAMLMKERSSGYINFVSHAGRDIMNGLAQTHLGMTRIQTQYVNIVEDKIKAKWAPIELPQSEDDKPTDKSYSITDGAYTAIDHLVCEHNMGRERNRRSDGLFFQTFLNIAPDEALKLQLLQKWKTSKTGFQKMTHISREAHKTDAPDRLEQCYEYLLMLLHHAASRYYEQTNNLHDILEDTNQPAN
tara:strand:- start:3317 stop:3964 length:648 start_codon:yes stop_codon:yes gene_type:complete